MGVYSKKRLVAAAVPLMMALYSVCCAFVAAVALVKLPNSRDSHLKLLNSRFCSIAPQLFGIGVDVQQTTATGISNAMHDSCLNKAVHML